MSVLFGRLEKSEREIGKIGKMGKEDFKGLFVNVPGSKIHFSHRKSLSKCS